MHIPALLAGILVLVSLENACASELCGYEVTSIERMAARIRAQPGAQVILDDARYLAVTEPSQMALWTFARPTDPLGPVYICRKVEQVGNQLSMRLSAYCNGPKPACDAFIARVLADTRKATDALHAP